MKRRRHLAPLAKRPVPTIGVAYSGFGGVNVPVTKHYDSGSSTGGLVEAINSLSGANGDVYAYPHTHPITANYTIPANAHMIVPKGALFNISDGVTLTINGTFEGDLSQHFSGAGTVTFGTNPLIDVIYPQWWGGETGSASCQADAIQAAIDASDSSRLTLVRLTGGVWAIEKSLILRDSVSVEGMGDETLIYCQTNHFPAFVNDPASASRHFSVKNLRITYEVLGTPSDNSEDCGFKFTGTTYSPYFFKLENILIYCAYWAFYDSSSSFMAKLSRIWACECRNGFYKQGGTTFHFENCYAKGNDDADVDGYGWYLHTIRDCSLTACAMDTFYTTAAAVFQNCYGLTINGFDFEMNSTEAGATGRIIYMDGCKGFSINGLSSYDNHLHTGTGYEAYIIQIRDSVGRVSGIDIGSNQGDDTDATAGTVHSLALGAACFLEISGCRIDTVAGGSPTKYAIYSGCDAGSSVVEVGCQVQINGGGTARGDANDTMCRVWGATGIEDE